MQVQKTLMEVRLKTLMQAQKTFSISSFLRSSLRFSYVPPSIPLSIHSLFTTLILSSSIHLFILSFIAFILHFLLRSTLLPSFSHSSISHLLLFFLIYSFLLSLISFFLLFLHSFSIFFLPHFLFPSSLHLFHYYASFAPRSLHSCFSSPLHFTSLH